MKKNLRASLIYVMLICVSTGCSNGKSENLSIDSPKLKNQSNSIKIEKQEISQDEEQYEKTIEFIRSKLEYPNNLVSKGNCQFEFRHEYGEFMAKLTLSGFNPNDVNIQLDEFVEINTTGQKKSIRVYLIDKNIEKQDYNYHNRNSIIFHVKDPDKNVNRVRKTFQWLIEHCGGKDEMY